ncbi:hypothetical protein M422DRAFT_258777 [Sphaerobolus stellatus SS14]|uniref:Alpha-type protein kinase domain-containing protein n=1 Tax=Sphaerobolus stellatus (strain SS14) TaxID=990650 RepID=A0A0C9UUA6_SPHS4|nr:hypothetical protein M422DRAFT_258777 [Sphaerobolus stellatus SS14]
MGTCSGCHTSYPALSSDSCGRCTKLQGKTETECRAIKSRPQCRGCSVVYLNLSGPLCGRCIANGVKVEDTYEEEFDDSAVEDLTLEPEAGPSTTVSGLMQCAKSHRANATIHRLKKQPKNPGLIKSDDYKALRQLAHKASVKLSRKKTQDQQVLENSRIAFMIYLRMCINSRAVAACPDAIDFSAPPTSKLEDAVYGMLREVEKAFAESPLARKLVKEHNFTRPSFLLDDVEIVTKESKALRSERIQFKDIFPSTRTFGKYFEGLKTASKLSAADIQRRSISIKLTDEENSSTEDSDEEITDGVGQYKGKRKKRDSDSSNKRSRVDTDLDNDQDVSELHSDVEPVQVTRSARARQKKLDIKSSTRQPAIVAAPNAILQQGPNEVEFELFHTPYHCQPHFNTSRYDTFLFQRTSCIITPDGEILIHHSNVNELIAVHKNWPAYCNQRLGAVGGYLGKGTRKWGFKGYTALGNFVLFHLGGLHFFSGVQQSFNHTTLVDELKSLLIADYHLNIFKKRAAHYGVILPRIRYNAEGAFVGELIIEDDTIPAPSYGAADTRTMPYNTFLATRLLDLTGRVEIRFTDLEGKLGQDVTDQEEVDHVFTAFTHSVLVNSIFLDDGELVLYDPQVHSVSQEWSLADEGRVIINRFLRQHQCNESCRKLHLEGASPKSIPPLPAVENRTDSKATDEINPPLAQLPSVQQLFNMQSTGSVSVVLPPLSTRPIHSQGPLCIGME